MHSETLDDQGNRIHQISNQPAVPSGSIAKIVNDNIEQFQQQQEVSSCISFVSNWILNHY